MTSGYLSDGFAEDCLDTPKRQITPVRPGAAATGNGGVTVRGIHNRDCQADNHNVNKGSVTMVTDMTAKC